MPSDPKTIEKSRQAEREHLLPQERKQHALEQIADTLESIREELEKLREAVTRSGGP